MSKHWRNPLDVTEKNIDQYAQNRTELVVDDLCRLLGLDEQGAAVVRKVLLARGVNKWLTARRRIIRLKYAMKADINATIAAIHLAKQNRNKKVREENRGRIKALTLYRELLRDICHSPRWTEKA